MTAAQTKLYFFEWGQVRKHYLAKGIDAKQVDAKRHELHQRALGRARSSKDLSNAELDKVIAVFRAVYDGGNLDAQLAQLDQPENRRLQLIKRCRHAAGSFIEGDDEYEVEKNITAYLDGTADRMFGVSFVSLDQGQVGDAQLRKVMGALDRTARVRKAKQAPAEAPARDYTVRREVLGEVERARLKRDEPF
jgi:hypothetical protein